ncbi:hypothetical protein D3C72_2214800 [compost metagenome]
MTVNDLPCWLLKRVPIQARVAVNMAGIFQFTYQWSRCPASYGRGRAQEMQ